MPALMWTAEDHTADIRLAVEAASWPELLAEATRAFGGWVRDAAGPPAESETSAGHELSVGHEQPAVAWVDWWRGLLRLWSVEGCLPVDARVPADAEPSGTRGRILVLPRSALDLSACAEVKAVTWHRAAASGGDAGWRGTIVLDI